MQREKLRHRMAASATRSARIAVKKENSSAGGTIWNFFFCPAYFPLPRKTRGNGAGDSAA